MKKPVTQTVRNTKKTVHQNAHSNEAAYSGSVTAVTPKTIVVFIPALDAEAEVLSKTIEVCRKANGIRTSEIIGDHGRFPEPDMHGMPPEPCCEHLHD